MLKPKKPVRMMPFKIKVDPKKKNKKLPSKMMGGKMSPSDMMEYQKKTKGMPMMKKGGMSCCGGKGCMKCGGKKYEYGGSIYKDNTNSRGTRTQVATSSNGDKTIKVTEKGNTIPGKTISKKLASGSTYSYKTNPTTAPGRVTTKVITKKGTATKVSPGSKVVKGPTDSGFYKEPSNTYLANYSKGLGKLDRSSSEMGTPSKRKPAPKKFMMGGEKKIARLSKREDMLVYKGNKAVDEGRDKKATRILGRAANVENRLIKARSVKK